MHCRGEEMATHALRVDAGPGVPPAVLYLVLRSFTTGPSELSFLVIATRNYRSHNPRVAGSSPAGPTIQFGTPPNLFPTSKLNGNNYTDRTCDQGGDVFSGGIPPPKSKRGVTATRRVAPSGERQLPYGERSDERLRGERRRRSVRVLLGPPTIILLEQAHQAIQTKPSESRRSS